MSTVKCPKRVGGWEVRAALSRDEPALRVVNEAAGVGRDEHRRELQRWWYYTHLFEMNGRALGYIIDRLRKGDDVHVIRLVTRPGEFAAAMALIESVFEPADWFEHRWSEEGNGRVTGRQRFEDWKAKSRFAIGIAKESSTSDVLGLCRTEASAGILADALEEAGEPQWWLPLALRAGDELAERIARAVALGTEL
jgi:hypothetical protein